MALLLLLLALVLISFIMKKIMELLKRIPWRRNAKFTLMKQELIPELIPIKTLNYQTVQKTLSVLYPLPCSKSNRYQYISNTADLASVCSEVLSKQLVLGVDIENDCIRSYYGKTCLIQVSTAHNRTFLVDCLAMPGEVISNNLGPIMQNSKIIKIFHNCSCDVLWLQRDFNGMRCNNIFDTYIMAQKLGQLKSLGLEKLWSHYCQHKVPSEFKKQLQVSDWAARPLSKEQLDYAAMDPYFLIYLRSSLIIDFFKSEKFENKEKDLIRILKDMQSLSTDRTYDKNIFNRNVNYIGFLKRKLGVIDESAVVVEDVFAQLWSLRNKEGQIRDLDLYHLCNPNVLFTIASRLPESSEALNEIINKETKGHEFVHKYSKEIIQIILQSKAKWKNNPEQMRLNSPLFNNTLHKKNQTNKEKNLTSSVSKKTLYENCRIMDPDGEFLCNCDKRKTEWYLKRELATLITEEPFTIQLKFKPIGRDNRSQKQIEDDLFYTEPRDNSCVCCGAKNNLQKYHVIPTTYRQHLPKSCKAHRSHDILLLCSICHCKSTKNAEELMKELYDKYIAPQQTEEKAEMQRNMRKAKNLAKRMIEMKGKEQTEDLTKALTKITKSLIGAIIPLEEQKIIKPLSNTEAIENEKLEEIAKLNNDIEESAGAIVVRSINNIEEFIKMWRKRFVEHIKPRFLPKGWSVEHRIDRAFGEKSAFSKDD